MELGPELTHGILGSGPLSEVSESLSLSVSLSELSESVTAANGGDFDRLYYKNSQNQI